MRLSALLLFATIASLAFAQPSPEMVLLEPANWQGMFDSPPVSRRTEDGATILEFPCNYAATKAPRASWDCPVKLDFAAGEAIEFEIRCDDPTPVGGWSMYFQSGNGWYSTRFTPGARGKWSPVRIRKEDSGIEGTPAGWSKITTIRLSAWRGQNRDTRFAVRAVKLHRGPSAIMVVRAESAASTRRNEMDSISAYTDRMCLSLRGLGLANSMVSDLDLTPALLREARVVVLPHNPAMSEDAQKALVDYMKSGGRVLGFYAVPGEILAAAGIRPVRHVTQTQPGSFAAIAADVGALPGTPERTAQRSWNIQLVQPAAQSTQVAAEWLDSSGNRTGMPAIVKSPSLIYMSHVLLQDDPQRKARLVLAMVGTLWPEAWRIAADRSLRDAGAIGQYASFDAAAEALGQSAAAKGSVEQAKALRESARKFVADNKLPEALEMTVKIRDSMAEAFAKAQSPMAGEFRALWCHRANGVDGMTWDQSIKLLADNGFTAIIPNMLWGGVAYYKSDVLPVAPSVAAGDPLQQCIDACRKHGIQVHVWKVNWNMGGQAPREFVDRMVREGRTQASFDGKQNPQWLCPSHPANQQLEIDAMVEVASKYDVDGIHFDYIRYPGPEGCFCAGCRERFEKVVGRTIANWPAEVRSDEKLAQQWNDFRRDNITRVVAGVSEKVRPLNKPLKISAAVFANWTVDRDSVGQDWKLWCERGYLDFVCPMDYTSSNADFQGKVSNQLTWAGKTPVYPGIGLSTWSGPRRDLVKLIEQINITREAGTKGFVIFEYNADEARDIVPLCGMGITRK